MPAAGFKMRRKTVRGEGEGTVKEFLVGTLRSEDGDGRENVAEKVNSRSFNLHHD